MFITNRFRIGETDGVSYDHVNKFHTDAGSEESKRSNRIKKGVKMIWKI